LENSNYSVNISPIHDHITKDLPMTWRLLIPIPAAILNISVCAS